MEPETATIIGAIIGAVLTGPVTYFLSNHLSRKQGFNAAAAVFREAFLEEKIKLRKADTDVFTILSEDAFCKHEKALIIFEPYLSKRCLKCLKIKWNAYKKYVNLETQEVAPGSVDIRASESSKALEVIESVLNCARPM